MRIFHVGRKEKYHRGNSIRGIRRAHRRGYPAIDLDILMTLCGVIIGCHWPRPLLRDGFRDPKRRVSKTADVADLRWVVVRRLVAGWVTRYRIQRIETLLAECARVGIIAVLEPKGDPRFDHRATWDYIAKVADDKGADVKVRALPQNASALPAARAAGFQAWEIR